MELPQITCGRCGAGLSVSGSPNFVDCRHCGASLRVVRSESAIYTELHERVGALEGDIDDLRKQSRLQDLDMRWAAQRRRFHVKGEVLDGVGLRRHGNLVTGLCGALAFALLVIFVAIGHGQFFEPLFLAGVALIVGAFVWRHFRKLEASYFAEEAAYRRARGAIERGESP